MRRLCLRSPLARRTALRRRRALRTARGVCCVARDRDRRGGDLNRAPRDLCVRPPPRPGRRAGRGGAATMLRRRWLAEALAPRRLGPCLHDDVIGVAEHGHRWSPAGENFSLAMTGVVATASLRRWRGDDDGSAWRADGRRACCKANSDAAWRVLRTCSGTRGGLKAATGKTRVQFAIAKTTQISPSASLRGPRTVSVDG